MIYNYLYRTPDYLTPLAIDNVKYIVIHHTGNDNDIDTNTDYHMDNNKWNWLGYGYYVKNGVAYRVRGYKHINAATKGHNEESINIAVQGNFNKKKVSQKDLKACQECINEIVTVADIEAIKGHTDFNNTTCPGKNFPMEKLTLRSNKQSKELLSEVLKRLSDKIARLEDRHKVMNETYGQLESKFSRLNERERQNKAAIKELERRLKKHDSKFSILESVVERRMGR